MAGTSRPNLTLQRVIAHSDQVSLQPISWRKLFDEEQQKKQSSSSSSSTSTKVKSQKSQNTQVSSPDATSPKRAQAGVQPNRSTDREEAEISDVWSKRDRPAKVKSSKGAENSSNNNSNNNNSVGVGSLDEAFLQDDTNLTASKSAEETELEQFKASGAPFIDTRTKPNNDNDRLQRLLLLRSKLLMNVKWCWSSPGMTVPIVESPPKTPEEVLRFYRDFVHKNTPCIIRGLDVCKWPKDWSWRDLQKCRSRHGRESTVRVNATPTGRGDAVIVDPVDPSKRLFVRPEERKMELEEYLDWLLSEEMTDENKGTVLYLSAQNDSLRDEFTDLIEDGFAPSSLDFGDQVFGKRADAVNLWIGDQRAVSSMHRDTTYENLYCVVRGTKVFHLLPPCCAPFLKEIPYQNADYRFAAGKWSIERGPDGEKTPWIEIDVAEIEIDRSPSMEYGMIVDLVQRVEVHEGETLFLPAGWFHRVTQLEPTLAVNYWYDRDFNATWALTEAVEHLVDNTWNFQKTLVEALLTENACTMKLL